MDKKHIFTLKRPGLWTDQHGCLMTAAHEGGYATTKMEGRNQIWQETTYLELPSRKWKREVVISEQ